MLARQLGTHPDVTCYLALFSRNEFLVYDHDDTAALRARLGDRWQDWDSRHTDPYAFLSAMTGATPQTKAVGLKQHLSGPESATEAMIGGWADRLIFLTRPNHLATYSSAKLANEAGWKQREPGQPQAVDTIRFDADDFAKHVRNRERLDAKWRGRIMDAGALEISYTQARRREPIEEIWRFLGVDPALGGEPDILKKNPDDLLARFDNPEEVTAWLRANDRIEWAEPEL